MTQNLALENQLKEIDSLIKYSQLKKAQTKCDELLSVIDDNYSKSNSISYSLELKFRQGVILDRLEVNIPEQLQLFLELIDKAHSEKLHSLTYRIYLMIALSYEKAGNFDLTYKYLTLAHNIYKKHNLEELYSTYCVRKSSYHRMINELDVALSYAKKANVFANLYDNQTDLIDSYILLGILYAKTGNPEEAIKYYNLLLLNFKKFNDVGSVVINYLNIANTYKKIERYEEALVYIDSAKIDYSQLPLNYKVSYYKVKYEVLEKLGKVDSALFYHKLYHKHHLDDKEKFEKIKTKELEEQYQNIKNTEKIRSNNLQLLYVLGFFTFIIITSLLIFRKNSKIKSQNKIINRQLLEMAKLLDQKKVLLSELQHRVKNNLQHVISILEIQKESADFNNIDELLRSNQNRIHSMALLHKKLNVFENVNDVDLNKYVTELADLVKESYDTRHRIISLSIKCEVQALSIDKVFPLGLIVVELVSNSMKHAFANRNVGVINIEITNFNNRVRMVYYDNGIGYNFENKTDKGLGIEIIRGLIDQLDGVFHSKNNFGFEITIEFP